MSRFFNKLKSGAQRFFGKVASDAPRILGKDFKHIKRWGDYFEEN